MPELPEVETIRRGLDKLIVGQRILKIEILNAGSYSGELAAGKVLGLRRFGKALVVDLEGERSLLIHLRMTGQLIYDADDVAAGGFSGRYAAGHPSDNFVAKLPNKQTRVVIILERGKLYFNDQRKFGFMRNYSSGDIKNDSFIRKLAKEPWNISLDELSEALKRRKNTTIKAAILDQTVVAGLGNIYADEALFAAKIHPERRVGTLTSAEIERLLLAAREVMAQAIESGGSTMATYVKADGTRGDYLEKFAKVFHREGGKCYDCGDRIVKIRVAGRGTHICPTCQKINVGEKE